MPLYTENFDELSAGQNPAGWTVSPASGTWGAQSSGQALSGINVYSPAGRTGQYWACYTGFSYSGVSVLAAVRFAAATSGKCGPVVQANVASAPTLQGYVGTLQILQDGAASAVIRRVGFTPLVLAAASGNYPDGSVPQLGDWIWIRLTYDASVHQVAMRWWKNGSTEPSTWTLTTADSTFASGGYAGLFCEDANPAIFDSFEIDALSGVAPSPPTITSFSPSSGPVGMTVTINGAHFSNVPGDNVIAFDGVVAPPALSATATQLVVHVPFGASTGAITVQTGGGLATSATSFTVTPPVGTGTAPTIVSFTPLSGPAGTVVAITGTNFETTASSDQVSIGSVPAPVTQALATELTITVPPNAVTGPITVTTGSGSATSSTAFTVTASSTGGIGGVTGITGDAYQGEPYDGLSGPNGFQGMISYLRAMLKDTLSDIQQLGLSLPTWSDADLLRYLELARGEYSRHRPRQAYVVQQTVAQQQVYSVQVASSEGVDRCLAVREVFWAPAGYDLDQISALAAALAGGPGILWGGGVPVVGRVYFDSPASIQVWSTIREAWRNSFGGHWMPQGPDQFWLLPAPAQGGIDVLVFYDTERSWRDIPWQHRMFILAYAELLAVEALTYQVVAQAPAQGAKLNLGLRALTQLIQQQYADVLNIRQPGVMAGRS